ncbi:hypothetical protein GLYMA_13G285450v4 [Glycine max]|nr:hypothetical protein GLYMA_13G285450v4 [Glycine max]KAH1103862.1 hypothetical protein GYH30_037667 [Glycine max]
MCRLLISVMSFILPQSYPAPACLTFPDPFKFVYHKT